MENNNEFNILNYFNPDSLTPDLVRLSQLSRDFANAFSDGGPGGQGIISWQLQAKIATYAEGIAIPLDLAITFSKEYNETNGNWEWSALYGGSKVATGLGLGAVIKPALQVALTLAGLSPTGLALRATVFVGTSAVTWLVSEAGDNELRALLSDPVEYVGTAPDRIYSKSIEVSSNAYVAAGDFFYDTKQKVVQIYGGVSAQASYYWDQITSFLGFNAQLSASSGLPGMNWELIGPNPGWSGPTSGTIYFSPTVPAITTLNNTINQYSLSSDGNSWIVNQSGVNSKGQHYINAYEGDKITLRNQSGGRVVLDPSILNSDKDLNRSISILNGLSSTGNLQSALLKQNGISIGSYTTGNQAPSLDATSANLIMNLGNNGLWDSIDWYSTQPVTSLDSLFAGTMLDASELRVGAQLRVHVNGNLSSDKLFVPGNFGDFAAGEGIGSYNSNDVQSVTWNGQVGSLVNAAAQVVVNGATVAVKTIIDTVSNRVDAIAGFLTDYSNTVKDFYSVQNPQGTSLLQSSLVSLVSRLAQGEDFDDILVDTIATILATPGINAVLNEMFAGTGVTPPNYVAYLKNALSTILVSAVVNGGENIGAVAQNVSFQTAVTYGISLMDNQVFFENNMLTPAGTGIVAGLTTLASSVLSGDGINSDTLRQAGIAAGIGYASSAVATAFVGSSVAASLSSFLGFAIAAGPLSMAVGIVIGMAIQGIFKAKIVHNETISHRVEVQPDGSLRVIGLRQAGALLRTTGNTNDDYYGTDSADDSAGADVIVGQAGKNEIYGRGGHDFIEGRANDDYIEAGTGNDHVEAGDGNDYVDGGNGDDRIYGGRGNDNILGGNGNDLVIGGEGDDRIEGNAGNDQLFGGNGVDTIIGGAGDDIIDGGSGNDILSGEAGDDEIDGGAGDDDIRGGDGNDLLSGGEGNDDIRGENGDDIIFGEEGVDVLYGGAGNDGLDGGNENDLLFGGIGNDTLVGGFGNDDLYGEMGNDLLAGGKGNDLLNGGIGDDLYIFNVGDGQDIIEDEAGANSLLLKGEFPSNVQLNRVANDLLIGWIGSTDTITVKNHFVTPAISEIYFDTNKAKIILNNVTFDNAGLGSYNLSLGASLPSIFASQKSMYQQLTAPFMASTSFSTVWLTNNFDTAVINDAYQLELYNNVQVRSITKRNWYGKKKITYYDYYETVLRGSGYSERIVGLFNGETISGESFNDQLYGNGGNDTINGGIDHDIIFGGEGNDQLNGDAGNDKIFGGFGIDTITGGIGNDTLYGEQGNDNVFGGEGDDFLSGGDGNDTLNGDDGNDLLFGDAGDDILNGGNGDDYLNGGVGNDTLNGGAGKDIIFGEDGNDIINGGDGDDIIIGGRGINTIDGGNGLDTLELSGDPSDYQIILNSNGTVSVVDLRPDAPDGNNTLTSIEKLSFADKEIILDSVFKDKIGNIQIVTSEQYSSDVSIPQGYEIAIITPPSVGNAQLQFGSNGLAKLIYTAPNNAGSTSFTYRLISPDGIQSQPLVANINIIPGMGETNYQVAGELQVSPSTVVVVELEMLRNHSAALSDGGYVVTYVKNTTTGYDIYARRFDAYGQALGAEFVVNSALSGSQRMPVTIGLANGGYAIAYASNSDTQFDEILVQRYNSSDQKVGSAIVIDSAQGANGISTQLTPSMAYLDNGTLAVTWVTGNTNALNPTSEIMFRTYNSSGTAMISEVAINQGVLSDGKSSPKITALTNSNFLISWTVGNNRDSSGSGVYARIVNASGVAQTSQFLVNTYTAGDQNEISVASLASGNFVITWTSAGQDGDGSGVYGQIFSNAGVKLGTEFRVNTSTAYNQKSASVTALQNGGFFVVWTGHDGSDVVSPNNVSNLGVFGQYFNSSGEKIGDQLLVAGGYQGQSLPSVVELKNGYGDVVVSWHYRGSTNEVRSTMLWKFTNDTIEVLGGSGEDVIVGGNTNNIIVGNSGNDIIVGNGGYDTINGGDGVDTVVFKGVLADYWVFINPDNTLSVNGINSANPYEYGAISNVEKLKFADQTVDLTTLFPTIPDIVLAPGAYYDGKIDLNGYTLMEVVDPQGGSTLSMSSNGSYRLTAVGSLSGELDYTYKLRAPNGIIKTVKSTLIIPQHLNAEYEVSQYSSNNYFDVAASALAPKVVSLKNPDHISGGHYVVVWASANDSQSYNMLDIKAQIFNGLGNEIGIMTLGSSELDIAPMGNRGYNQFMPEAISTENGGFIVTWLSSINANTNQFQIQSRVIGAYGRNSATSVETISLAGNPLSIASTYVPGNGGYSTGKIITVYQIDDGSGGTQIWGVERTPAGSKSGNEFQVSTGVGLKANVDVQVLSNGNYVVVWEDKSGADGDSSGVYARIFSSSNVAVGSEFLVNSYTFNKQEMPRVTALNAGGFVVTWSSFGQDGFMEGVFAQLFNNAGTKEGPVFQINTTTDLRQMQPSITSLQDGGFVVTWASLGNNGGMTTWNIYARKYNASGVAVGGEFLVNQSSDAHHVYPDVTQSATGDIIFVWQAGGLDGRNTVRTLRYTGQEYVTLTGNDEDNIIGGSTGSDTIFGLAGNDSIIGGGGNDTIDGGDGDDIAIYHGNRSNFSITILDGSVQVLDNRTNSPEGSDILYNIENIKFNDGTVNVTNTLPVFGRLKTSLGKVFTYPIPNGATVTILTQPTLGTLTIVNGQLVYTSPTDSIGSTQFSYELSTNGIVRQSTANIDIFPISAGSLGYNGTPESVISVITANNTGEDVTSMVRLKNGSYAVTYANGAANNSRIYVARFTSAGVAIGTPVMVNNAAGTQDQSSSKVISLNDGGFAVIYSGFNGNNANRSEVYLKRYDSSGNGVGAVIQVNPTTVGDQNWTTATVLNDGSFVVAYQQVNATNNGINSGAAWTSSINVKRYDVAGVAIGAEVIVSTVPASHPRFPSITTLTNGNYLVTWQTGPQNPNLGTSVVGQIMTATGQKVGAEFSITSASSDVYFSYVAPLATGGFVVTWNGPDANGQGIFARWYNAQGQAISGNIGINSFTTNHQRYPEITALSDGGIFITWSSYTEDGSENAIKGQRYDRSGNSVGQNITINTTTNGNQFGSTVIELANGDLVFTWEDRSIANQPRIIQRRLTALGEGGYVLTGDSGNDLLVGGNANDIINGADGDDVLIGGLGNDTLIGGIGNDTYNFGTGHGADIIDNQDSEGTDKISFGAGIERHDLWFSQKGYDLKIDQLGTFDSVTVQGWYLNDTQRVDEITLSDGSKLTKAKIDQLVSAMAGFNPQAIGSISALSDLPQSVQNTITATWN